MGGVVSWAIRVAAELGIADRLADGPRTTAELAQAANAEAGRLFRLMRFLISLGVFQDDGHACGASRRWPGGRVPTCRIRCGPAPG